MQHISLTLLLQNWQLRSLYVLIKKNKIDVVQYVMYVMRLDITFIYFLQFFLPPKTDSLGK